MWLTLNREYPANWSHPKPLLEARTQILTLLGTYGANPAWCDRHQSTGHLAIPLVSSAFVRNIPMVTRLMESMGVGLGWLDQSDTGIVVKKLGNSVGVFYVEDAAAEKDGEGRLVVSAQDFVRTEGIRSVFGLGGSYLDGRFLCFIAFAREHLSRELVTSLMPLLSHFKANTSGIKAILDGSVI